MVDALGNPLHKYNVVAVGNRSRFGVYVIIDDAPTPFGYIRAAWYTDRFQHYDESGNIVRENELVPTIIKDIESTVKLHVDNYPPWVFAMVKEARRRYGQRSS